jgi:hypothetical protein
MSRMVKTAFTPGLAKLIASAEAAAPGAARFIGGSGRGALAGGVGGFLNAEDDKGLSGFLGGALGGAALGGLGGLAGGRIVRNARTGLTDQAYGVQRAGELGGEARLRVLSGKAYTNDPFAYRPRVDPATGVMRTPAQQGAVTDARRLRVLNERLTAAGKPTVSALPAQKTTVKIPRRNADGSFAKDPSGKIIRDEMALTDPRVNAHLTQRQNALVDQSKARLESAILGAKNQAALGNSLSWAGGLGGGLLGAELVGANDKPWYRF